MVLPKYMAIGGSLHLSYWMIRDYMNYEHPNEDFPDFYKHEIALAFTSFFGSLGAWGLSGNVVAATLATTLVYGPIVWSASLRRHN